MSNVKKETVVVDLDALIAITHLCRVSMLASNSTKDYLCHLERAIADKKVELGISRPIEIGNIVKPLPAHNTLRAGNTAYGEVVVLSLNPFVVGSADKKYKWDNVSAERFVYEGLMYGSVVRELREYWNIAT